MLVWFLGSFHGNFFFSKTNEFCIWKMGCGLVTSGRSSGMGDIGGMDFYIAVSSQYSRSSL